MKIKDIKHNHSLTDLLKVSIFSLLMLAPIGAIGITCAYVICNKNAYQSYSGAIERQEIQAQPLYATNDFTNQSEMVLNNYYYFSLDYTINQTQNSYSAFTSGDSGHNIFRIINIYTSSNLEEYPLMIKNYCDGYIDYFDFNTNIQLNADGVGLLNGDNNLDHLFEISLNNTYYEYTSFNVSFIFQYLSNNDQFTADFLSHCSAVPSQYQTYNITTTNITDNSLDNVFYYAVNQMTQSELFNWTENTAVYSGVKQMTDNLGITSQAIPMLIVYWFMLTIIYIIIDILLKCFTTLTHLLSKS